MSTVNVSATARSMSAEGMRFLASLSPEELREVRQDAHARPGSEWNFTPGERRGLALCDMSPRSQQYALRLLSTSLSPAGFALASYVMGLENVLAVDEGWTELYPGRPEHGRSRDPMMYFVTVFGEPGDAAWGWQFSGHHLVVHAWVERGAVVSLTPHFIGVNPSQAPALGRNELRPLRGEEIIAAEIVGRLTEAERQEAVFSPIAPSDILQQNRPLVDDEAVPLAPEAIYPSGVSSRQSRDFLGALGFTEEQAGRASDPPEILRHAESDPRSRGMRVAETDPGTQALVEELLTHYVDRFPRETHRRVFGWTPGDALPTDLRFAWAGEYERGVGRYYCFDSHAITIEFDNTQNRANHIHSALRSRKTDFASDILRAHYDAEHAKG
ncbi:DUF3500 domain-containing protein [Leucobacter chromiiresistens]|nr:DUF3500 domain-containing protein [Leucobacter chromiiresistens]